MQLAASTRPAGSLGLRVVRGGRESPPWPARELTLGEIARFGLPARGLPNHVNAWRRRNRRNLARGLRAVLAARALRLPHFYGQLWLTVIRGDGRVEELGLASLRLVTDAGVEFIVDGFQALVTLNDMKFHGFGTGIAAEAAGDTALAAEETTQYTTDNTRPTGTTLEGATANIYRTVATYSPDSGGTRAITEHGVFSQAATGGGVLLDRSVFSAVNLVAGSDSLQATYDFTLVSGS